ncbi:hypothetical protein GcM1_182008 [Golovinomyces cichoracearum]|uniref:Uncharacterized protein n=1 Tax=Golovinomyces cichoracearum TaxID=62708 RepID=A0A420J3T7_9PEZI|nr:hypothetical protein GcM1_182008 [Golovinomyces cichoracearum]
MLMEAEIEEAERILVDVIVQLPIANPMSITALLSPIEEKKILADMDEEVDTGNEATEEPKIQKREKLHALQGTISLLNITKTSHIFAHKILGEVQQRFRTESRRQTTIDCWLGKTPTN